MKKIMVLIFLMIFLVGCEFASSVIELPYGKDVIGLNEVYTDVGCKVVTGSESVEMDVVLNEVDTSTPGLYEITYEKTIRENTYTCQRFVLVVDKIPPQATLNVGIDTIHVNEEHTDAGITTSDNYDEMPTVEVTSTVDITVAGTYQIQYIVRDEALNTFVITRIVTVLANN